MSFTSLHIAILSWYHLMSTKCARQINHRKIFVHNWVTRVSHLTFVIMYYFNNCIVLIPHCLKNFMSIVITWSHLRRQPWSRKYLLLLGLRASLWVNILVACQCRMSLCIVDAAIPGIVFLGSIIEIQLSKPKGTNQLTSIFHGFCFFSCLRDPAMNSPNDRKCQMK